MNEPVSLCPMTVEMYHAYYREYQNDPDLYINKNEYKPFVYSPEWVDRYIQRQIERNRKSLAVMHGEEIAGEIILKDIEPGKSATLSICMKNDRYKGRGIGTQAERLAIDYVFHELDIPVLYADSILSNERSQHVLEKVGFQLLRTEGDFKYYIIERLSDISR
ncbi:MAG: GNAT family N-acetyltransferase [Oscillospiraceae bacterium]|nr:GNAT family N-acetyltransferase [Oscillospiraceae bacterium]